MGEIERKKNRTELVEEAYKLHLDGHSQTEIGRRIGRNRDTVREYIREYVEAQDDTAFQFQRSVSIARLEKTIAHAWDMLENGDIRDSSLTRPQLLHQIINAVKEINKISGLHVNQLHVRNTPATTLFEMINAEGFAFPDAYDHEEIEDAEVIAD